MAQALLHSLYLLIECDTLSKLKDLTKTIHLVSLSKFESNSVSDKKNFLKNELTHLNQNEEDIDIVDEDNYVLVENIPQQ